MTYIAGITGIDSNIGKYVGIVSDTKVNQTNSKDELIYTRTNAKKTKSTNGIEKFFYAEAGTNPTNPDHNIESYQYYVDNNSPTIELLEMNLNNLNFEKKPITKMRNNYVIGTPSLELYELIGDTKRMQKKNLFSTIGSGSPYGGIFLEEELGALKNEHQGKIPLNKSLYNLLESAKVAQECEPETVGGYADLTIMTKDKQFTYENIISLGSNYDFHLTKGISQRLTANHFLNGVKNTIEMMKSASSEMQRFLASQIAHSQNPQIAATVIKNIKLEKEVQEEMLPALLNGNVGFMEYVKDYIHPKLKDRLMHTIELNK